MKRISLLLTLALNICLFAQYSTPNTGVIWNPDSLVTYSGGVVTGSFPNYQINNNVIISANDQLIIQPGSILTFAATNAGIEVNGILKAVGTVTDSIVFTSTVVDTTGYYVGIRFNANPNSTLSEIRYARIYYADYGIRCIDASPVLSNSYLFRCGRGVQLSNSNATITNNIIEKSYEYGITMTLGSSPLIEGNYLLKNNTRATSAMNQISIGLQGNNSPIIRNNIIEGGESTPTGGISLWVSGSTSFSNAIIEGNQIFNNSFGITLYSTSNGIINAVVRDNIIYNNKINPNVMASGSGININGSPANQPIIKRNIIYGNWWGVTIQNGSTVQPGPQPNLGNVENADTTDDGMNIIFGNVQGSDVYDLYNNCTNDIYAQNNDWGVYDSLSIEQHIFHKADNPLHGLVKFIPFSLQIPVELNNFTARVNGNGVVLEWSTSTETNNQGFEIERSQKSEVKNQNDWEKIGFVNGNGTTTIAHNYSFTDNNLKSGKYYYRLKQIDYDGSYKYSQVVEAEITALTEFMLNQNYPNPFNPSTTVKFALPYDCNVKITVYNINGEIVKELANGLYTRGEHEVKFNMSDVKGSASGIYLYNIKATSVDGSKTFTQTKKMVIIK